MSDHVVCLTCGRQEPRHYGNAGGIPDGWVLVAGQKSWQIWCSHECRKADRSAKLADLTRQSQDLPGGYR